MKSWAEQWLEKLKNKKMAGQLVIYLGLLGMALIFFSELFWGTSSPAESQSGAQIISSEDSTQTTTVNISTEETYRASLEQSLTELISQLDGAGQTVVMITLVSGEESVYAQDITQSETQTSQSHVLLDGGSALTETVLTPAVCGVAVLCEGGDNIIIEAKITTLVTALFDISSNRVSVEKLG